LPENSLKVLINEYKVEFGEAMNICRKSFKPIQLMSENERN